MVSTNFTGWTIGMFRQLFAEMNPKKTFTAKELHEMFEEASPLLTEEQLKELSFINK